ncbi:AAEL017216-PA [Aedes aegypti]|uniref:Gustatory receptor n=1 Tax=Aedes aegypti TaxID=7159 RepID=J9HGH1_AEDAE|nr:AAEL017216-PA [Aedes aegypti]
MASLNPIVNAFNPMIKLHYCFGIANLLKPYRNHMLYLLYAAGCIISSIVLCIKCFADIFEEIHQKSIVTAITSTATIFVLEMAAISFPLQSVLGCLRRQENHVFHYIDRIDSEFNYQLKTSFDYGALNRDVKIKVAISFLLSIILQAISTVSIECCESIFCSMHRFTCTVIMINGNITFLCLLKELLRRVNRMNKLLKSNQLWQKGYKEQKHDKLKAWRTEIKFFSTIHTNCYLAIECMKKTYGYSHIATFAFCFYILTGYIFYVFINFSVVGMNFLYNILYPVASIITVIVYMLYVTVTCNEVTRENENLSHRIHKLGSDATKFIKQKEETNIDLEMVSHQLLHQKLVFCAHDFFDIDLKFLNLMVGAVTTYLIILLQF